MARPVGRPAPTLLIAPKRSQVPPSELRSAATALLTVPFAVLTALGDRRRNCRYPLALTSGHAFALSWAA